LRGLGETARVHRLRLVIAILPDGDQIGVADPDLLPQRKLLGICADAALDCLDLHPVFAAAAQDGELFFDIMHPNAAGHRLIARALAEHLLAAAGPPRRTPPASWPRSRAAPTTRSARASATAPRRAGGRRSSAASASAGSRRRSAWPARAA